MLKNKVKRIYRTRDQDRLLENGKWLGASWYECSNCRVFIYKEDIKCRGCGNKIAIEIPKNFWEKFLDGIVYGFKVIGWKVIHYIK